MERAHSRYEETPDELDDIIGWIAHPVLQPEPKPTPETLIALVRPETFDPDHAKNGLVRPIAGGLVGIVALDLPDSYTLAPADELRSELGMSDEAIWARALENTWSQFERRRPQLARDNIAGVSTDVRLAASLLLDDGFWDHPSMIAGGPLLVAPVERDELLAGYLDEPIVRTMRRIIAERSGGSEWLSDLILVRRDGRWEVLD